MVLLRGAAAWPLLPPQRSVARDRLRRFELLDPVSDGLYGHECFLKAAYVGCTADDTDPMAGYGAWSSSDPGWVGHSGPEVCPGNPFAVPDRSCLLVGMDYGGSPHNCGYATIIVIYLNAKLLQLIPAEDEWKWKARMMCTAT